MKNRKKKIGLLPFILIAIVYIASIVANQGPTMKRFMPRAMGRATMIRKRTSHIEVVLKERK